VAAQWSELVLNPGLVGVGAAAVGIGARRFPIYDTFGYALLIELAMLAAHFAIYHHVAMGQFDMLVVTSFAMLPVLARAVTLSPNPDEEGAQVRELAGKA